ncbi:MAG: type I restriction-modification system subunit M N-terminal domain-containing protein, partial [Phycisphaerales bacterium]|nr:type I restriction-modification system subunit M N-terminal domain-containing protein [Phycisphaerales bacterium]
MITGELKNKIDRIWLEFWQGGITNPLTVIEQITYLMFIRLLDLEETRLERQAARTKKPHKGHFTGPDDPRRWGALLHSGSQDALKVVRDDVFPHIKEIAGRNSTFGRYMADATFMINKPALLTKAMELINDLPLEKGDVKGDIYEYLLSKLTTAG